jgi:anti-anti-sigma factor
MIERTLHEPHRPLAPLVEVLVEYDLDISALPRLRDQLEDALRLRPDRLVLDLSRCGHVDAQAIVVLLDVHKQLYATGGRLVIRRASAAALRLLSLAGMRDVFAYEPPMGEAARAVAGAWV